MEPSLYLYLVLLTLLSAMISAEETSKCIYVEGMAPQNYTGDLNLHICNFDDFKTKTWLNLP